MFRNYLTVAFRHLNRQKGYSAINVMSLALGIACALLILLYIRDELSYDRYHEKADRIYRVISEERGGDAGGADRAYRADRRSHDAHGQIHARRLPRSGRHGALRPAR